MTEPDEMPTCRHCGWIKDWVECNRCGGDGYLQASDLDPMWHDEDEVVDCHDCKGEGGWIACYNPECKPQRPTCAAVPNS